jgi:hypothetical protein
VTNDDPLDAPETSIEGMAANGTGPGDDQPIFALEGDKQLTLAGLGTISKTPVEAEVSIMSASVPCRGLIDPQKPGQLLISYVPHTYKYVPVRDGDKIVKWKLRQFLRVMYVETVLPGEAQDAEEPVEQTS